MIIEFEIDDMGLEEDMEKRTRAEDAMNELLGWTGLGHCDGGSVGGGSMEVCCYVADFDIAQKVIAASFRDTEFANYTRIYDEGAE